MKKRIAVLLLILVVLTAPLLSVSPALADSDVFYASTSDGYLEVANTDYTGGRAQSDADTVSAAGDTLYVGQSPSTTVAVTGALAEDSGTLTDETTEANEATANDMNLTPNQQAGWCWVYNADTTNWTNETATLRDAAANDVDLVPLQATTAGDTVYFGFVGASDELSLNVGTAGVYSDITLSWEYSQGASGWNTLSVTDDTSGFTVSGTNSITYTAPGDWAIDTVNGTSDYYWIRAVCAFGGSEVVTTPPLGTQGWNPPGVGDAYYLGWVTEMPTKYNVNIGTAGTGTWAMTWEYYNGSWTALSGVVDGTSNFTAAGTSSIHWAKPVDAVKSTLESIEAYWVRARITSYTSVGVQATGTQAWVYDQCHIYRAGLFFDTSSLPDTAVATAATLSLNVDTDNSTTDFAVTVVDGSLLDDPLNAADYGELFGSTVGLGSANTSGAVVDSYLDITLNSAALPHINVIGTTEFALRSAEDISGSVPTDNEYILFKTSEEGTKPTLSITYTTTSGGTITTYPYSTYDGEIYDTDAVYATAQAATDGTVNDSAVTARVGQTTGFTIWRDVLFFNTTDVPVGSTITTVTVSLYGYSDSSDTEFDITVVTADAAETPLSTFDYDDLGNISLGEMNTASWGVGQYNNIVLDGFGRENIICGGITQLGLRSSRDIAAANPTGDEYVTFYTSESPNKPILYVTYILPSLGTPDLFEIVSARVFDDFIVDGDSLVVVEYKIYYSTTPSVNPQGYFLVQLLEVGTVAGQMRLPNWGHAVASIYISGGLDLDIAWYVKLVGDSNMFDTPPEQVVSIAGEWYLGDASRMLDIWVRWKAIGMREYYGADLVVYIEGVIHLNELGQAIFVPGIPGLDVEHPQLFQVAGIPLEPEEDGDYTPYDPEVGLGSYITGQLSMVGNAFGISGNMFGGLMLLIVVAACVAAMYKFTGNVVGGTVISVPIIVACGLLGIVPLVMIALIGVVCSALLMHGLWLSRT